MREDGALAYHLWRWLGLSWALVWRWKTGREISAPPFLGTHTMYYSLFLASSGFGLLHVMGWDEGGFLPPRWWSVVWIVRLGGWMNLVWSRVAIGDIGCSRMVCSSRDSLLRDGIFDCSSWSVSSAFDRWLVSSYFRISKLSCKKCFAGSSGYAYGTTS